MMPDTIDPLSIEQVKQIFIFEGRKLTYNPGATLVTPIDVAHFAFYLHKGCVRLSIINREGMEAIIAYAHDGEMVGVEATITGQPYGITAVALESSEAYVLSREKLLNLLYTTPACINFILSFLSSKIRTMGRHIMNLTMQDSYGRVAQVILDHFTNKQPLPSKGGNPNILSITHNELASYLGISRVTVTNILNVFQDQGIIKKGKGVIVLKNKEALKKWLK